MKLSLSHYGAVYSIEMTEEDLTLPEVIEELVIPLLLSIGFTREKIEAAMGDGPVKETR